MNQNLINVALSLGLSVSQFTTDAELEAAVLTKTAELKKPITTKPEESPAVANLTAEVTALKDARATELIDGAVAEMKIIPADRDHYISFAKSNFDLAKKTVDGLPVHATLTEKVVKEIPAGGKVDLGDAKFTVGGKKITYREFLKMDPNEQAKFTVAEVDELKKTNK